MWWWLLVLLRGLVPIDLEGLRPSVLCGRGAGRRHLRVCPSSLPRATSVGHLGPLWAGGTYPYWQQHTSSWPSTRGVAPLGAAGPIGLVVSAAARQAVALRLVAQLDRLPGCVSMMGSLWGGHSKR